MIIIEKSLSALTGLKLGGKARHQFKIENDSDFEKLKAYRDATSLGFLVLGGGFNVLAGDNPDGVVFKLPRKGIEITQNKIIASAGVPLSMIAAQAANLGRGGLEWTAAIPGTLGGALTMNAGAYGGETGNHVEWVESLTRDFEVVRIKNKEIKWQYRFAKYPVPVLCHLRACLSLAKSSPDNIRDRMREIRDIRTAKFPRGATAGSIFKNPVNHSAGALLEECEMKGVQIGGARVPKEHANIFVNDGGSFEDMMRLIVLARDRVRTMRNITLEPEVRIWDNLGLEGWEKRLLS